ncbi:efflux RND transporter periplasmic adaptor subunit [Bauldia sp.]|uniref:efflux RND transporter periplasmic adaptor subunit n=1 Tax=Bauldia sp. TaxID=2575872 RepID=UPI003BA9F19E
MNAHRMHVTVLAAGLAFSVIPAVSPASAQGGAPPAPVVVEAVTVEPMTQTLPVIGRVITLQASVIASDVAGGVAAVAAEVGDHVETDEVVVTLALGRLEAATALAEAELEEARSRVRSAEAAAASIRQDYERLETLQDSAAFTQARFDQLGHQLAEAEGQVGQARAGLNRAETALALARLDLDGARIKAPFPGVVVERHVELGEYVRVGDDILTLLNDESLEIDAAVPADRMAGLVVGRPLAVTFNGSSTEATLRAILPVEDSLSRTRVIRLTPEFDDANPPAIGASVTVDVPLGQSEDVVTISKDAIVNSPAGRIVFVVADDVVQPRPVAIGRSTGNRFEVTQGLGPGELIVVRGNEELRPGQAVQIIGGAPSADAAGGSTPASTDG